MKAMLYKIQNFFLDLRQRDEETKKTWLIILTSGTMLVVILLWIAYLNFTVQNLGQKEKDSYSFLETLKIGLGAVSEKTASELSQKLADLGSILKKTNSITIQTDDFQPMNLEEIKPKKLP